MKIRRRLIIRDRQRPQRAQTPTAWLNFHLFLQRLTSKIRGFWWNYSVLLFLGVGVLAWAAEPIAISLGHSDGKETGLLLPSAQVNTMLMVILQVAWGLVEIVRKKKEAAKGTKIIQLAAQLEEALKHLPTEDGIVKRIRAEVELIAIRAAREEIDRHGY